MTFYIAGLIILVFLGALCFIFGLAAWICDRIPIDRPDTEPDYLQTDPYPVQMMSEHLDLGSPKPQAWDAPYWSLER